MTTIVRRRAFLAGLLAATAVCSLSVVDAPAYSQGIASMAPGIGPAIPAIRQRLVAPRGYFVSTTGSDGNNGLSALTPFATLAFAVATAFNTLDLNGFNCTINCAGGTYTTTTGVSQQAPQVGAGRIIILGDLTTPSNVLINVTADNCFQMYNAAKIYIYGVKLQSTSNRAFYTAWGGTIYFNNVEFGACGDYHMRASAGYIWCQDDVNPLKYTISGGANAHMNAHIDGVIYAPSVAVTIANTPAFSEGMFHYGYGGTLRLDGMTFAGTGITGNTFVAEAGGSILITSNTSSAAFFPSNGGVGGVINNGGVAPDATATTGPGWRSQVINDQSFATLDLYGDQLQSVVLVQINTSSGAEAAVPCGQFRVRTGISGSGGFIENVSITLTKVTLTTGPLTGTTGLPTFFTISAGNDGKIYVENRSGTQRFITMQIMGN